MIKNIKKIVVSKLKEKNHLKQAGSFHRNSSLENKSIHQTINFSGPFYDCNFKTLFAEMLWKVCIIIFKEQHTIITPLW
jgi:hypothetical protein